MSGGEEAPLRKEAEKRDEWRDPDPAAPHADGHSLPASEDDDERPGGGDKDAAGHPGTIPPPD